MSEISTIKPQYEGGGKRHTFRLKNWERRLSGLKTVLLRGGGRGLCFHEGRKGEADCYEG